MKRVALLGAVAAVLAFVGQSTAAAPPRSISVTLTGKVTQSWNANSCCAWEWVFEGAREIPSLGYVKFTGNYDEVFVYVPDYGYHTWLYITFVGSNGDSFTVSGYSDLFAPDDPPSPVAWTMSNQTGRFTKFSASGTYTVPGLPNTNATTLSFTLAGTVTKS